MKKLIKLILGGGTVDFTPPPIAPEDSVEDEYNISFNLIEQTEEIDFNTSLNY